MQVKAILTSFFTIVALTCISQTRRVEVVSSHDTCGVYQNVSIEFIMENMYEADFEPPDFSEMKLVSGPTSQKTINIISGVTTSKTIISYTVLPQKSGVYTVKNAFAVHERDTFKFNALTIEVENYMAVSESHKSKQELISSANFSEQDIFLKLEADKKEVSVNEPVNLILKLYTANNMISNIAIKYFNQPEYCWHHQVFSEDVKSLGDTSIYDDKKHTIYELQKIQVLPLVPGEHLVEPIEYSIDVRLSTNKRKPSVFDFFSNNTYKDTTIIFRSNELTITAKPSGKNLKNSDPRYSIISNLNSTNNMVKFESDSNVNSIYFLIDVSASMMIKDFENGRLESISKIFTERMEQLSESFIGLGIFSDTFNHKASVELRHDDAIVHLRNLPTYITKSGGGLGMPIYQTVEQLKKSVGQKSIILITDAYIISDKIHPYLACDIAIKNGITIDVIGIGADGDAPHPYRAPDDEIIFQIDSIKLNEPMLKSIAEKTGGKYFRARSEVELRKAIMEILNFQFD